MRLIMQEKNIISKYSAQIREPVQLKQGKLSNEEIAEGLGLDIEVVNTLAKEQKEII